MKLLSATIVATMLYGGAHLLRGGESQAAVGEASPSAGNYRLLANGKPACRIARGAELRGGLSRLTIGSDCGSLLPGIARARFWREQEDGTVVFSENGVDPIVAFAVADGLDYESYAPALPLLSLMAE